MAAERLIGRPVNENVQNETALSPLLKEGNL